MAVPREAMVSNQIENVVRKGSPLITQARTSANEDFQTRGLLASTMGVEAGQEAIYRTALPIATADAATHAASALSKQQTGEQKGLLSTEYGLKGGLSKQEAGQQSTLQREQAGHTSALSTQEAGQAGTLQTQVGRQAINQIQQRETSSSNLQREQGIIAENSSSQDFREEQGLSRQAANQTNVLSRQEAYQAERQADRDHADDRLLSRQEARQAERQANRDHANDILLNQAQYSHEEIMQAAVFRHEDEVLNITQTFERSIQEMILEGNIDVAGIRAAATTSAAATSASASRYSSQISAGAQRYGYNVGAQTTAMTMVGDYGQTYMNSVNAILTTPGIADPEDALMTAQYAYQNSVTTAVDVGGLDVTFFDIGGSDETVPDETVPDETVPGDGATNPGNDYNEYTTGP